MAKLLGCISFFLSLSFSICCPLSAVAQQCTAYCECGGSVDDYYSGRINVPAGVHTGYFMARWLISCPGPVCNPCPTTTTTSTTTTEPTTSTTSTTTTTIQQISLLLPIVGNPEDRLESLPVDIGEPTPRITPLPTIQPTPTPDPCVANPIYRIHGDTTLGDYVDGRNFYTPVFSGKVPSCLRQIARRCSGFDGTLQGLVEWCGLYGNCSSYQSTLNSFSDDCMMGFILLGQVVNTGNTWWTYYVNPMYGRVPPGVTIESAYCDWRTTSCNSFTFTTYLDSNCQKVIKPSYVCGDGYARAIISPISLEWTPNWPQSKSETLVNFPLLPSNPEYWYSWRASGEFPLLVYDPEHKGEITDGKQLFGASTFGRSWSNGFQALATLDIDEDGKLTGDELLPLALWFDYDQDGVSQKGEVISLSALKVLTLYTGPVVDKGGDADIVLARGFERLVDGSLITGRAIDWFANTYSSKAEAALDSTLYFASSEGEDEAKNLMVAELERREKEKLSSWNGDSIAGSWEWELLDEGANRQLGQKKSLGVLRIRDRGFAEVDGYSLLEFGSKGTNQHAVKGYLMLGRKYYDQEGRTAVNFQIRVAKNYITNSRATLTLDGRHLIGESEAKIPLDSGRIQSIKYKWVAKKIS